MTDAALRTEKLTKHYGDVEALNDLDLEVGMGEVFGFLGPNGAGKTTMIRTVLDLIHPTRGRAWILGMDTHAESVAIREHIGYLPSDLAMYPRLTGRDTLRYFANLRGGVDWSYVDRLAERLSADLSMKVGEYSSGNRQKVGLIQAFMNRPRFLVMDEPSTGLDPLVQREFQSMVREVAEEGRSVFLSSHTLSEVQRVADRVGVIRNGYLVEVSAVEDLRSRAIRHVEFTYRSTVEVDGLSSLDGVRDVAATDNRVRLAFDGSMAELLAAATRLGELIDVASQEADLEEIFLSYYEGTEVSA
jgi:ABC-2 type transport system ATP-binding protein